MTTIAILRPRPALPVAALALLLTIARPAHAQADSAAVVSLAQRRALPAELLLNKMREGRLRRLPNAALQVALVSYADRLQLVQRALAPSPTPPEIKAGAEALAEGATPDVLRRVRSAGDGSVAVPLAVLTSLLANKVPVERAATSVVDLVTRGASPTQLIALSKNFEVDIAGGIAPTSALDARVEGLRRALPQPGGGVITNTDLRQGIKPATTPPHRP
jgi:hypothetical protein